MKNLKKVLEAKTLEDLKPVVVEKVSTLLEPTEAEIESIRVALKEGKSYKEVRKENRRVKEVDGKQVSAQGFSYGQIKEIDLAVKAKINELTPVEEPMEV